MKKIMKYKNKYNNVFNDNPIVYSIKNNVIHDDDYNDSNRITSKKIGTGKAPKDCRVWENIPGETIEGQSVWGSQRGEYRYSYEGALKDFYLKLKTWPVDQIFIMDKPKFEKMYNEIALPIFQRHFPTTLTLDQLLDKAIKHGAYQYGKLTLDGMPDRASCPFGRNYMVQGYNDDQKYFLQACANYNYCLKYYLKHNNFKNIIQLTAQDRIEITIDVTFPDMDQEPIFWASQTSQLTWYVRIKPKWITNNDEYTRNFLSKSDIQIKHSNNMLWAFLNRYDESGQRNNFWPVLLQQKPVNKIIIKNTSGNIIERDLITVPVYNRALTFLENDVDRSFDDVWSNITNRTNNQKQPLEYNAINIMFIGEGVNYDKPMILHINDNQRPQNRILYKVYPSGTPGDYPNNIVVTVPYIKNVNPSSLNIVEQERPVSAAYNSIAVVTQDGQLVTNIPFQFDKFFDNTYTFTAITDKIQYIDAVYVLGQKV